MRKVSLDSVRTGMTLAKSIFGSNGQVLLKAGVEIKPQYLTYLKQLGINQIYIQDSRMGDIEVNDIITDETRREAHSLVSDIMNDIQMGTSKSTSKKKGINLRDNDIVKAVSQIIEELLENKELTAQLQDLRTLNEYVFAHSVNCCVLATLVGVKMNLNNENLKLLSTGTLLHDIGMAAVPEAIINKSGNLTEEEYESIKRHPIYGYEMFKNTSIFDSRAGAIILQHHERFQGQGYPQGLKDQKIYYLAQIAGVVDVYDALTSVRPYRNAYQPHEAVEMLASWGQTNFNLEILKYFLTCIAAYPIGTHVLLSNKESGLVIANNSELTLRPVVRIIYVGEDLAPHPSPYDLDLSKHLNLTITKVLE
ncbi:HD-GYP domain-containing protein [Natranaerofaba carboxydovora]|uniref:HD-GYP domain-containing protein n=1 Tax=Natranaerofaba carboxydovora TaxID=2742683 RepID=UPI001F14032E|nr:HD-GYP domain-containing protein [Natranaerofaba carboxydovora]UMZ73750.1 Cyclic di-GMP phosphodiesterase response regulator RpfG [Natranaerofaba carboxydovora]